MSIFITNDIITQPSNKIESQVGYQSLKKEVGQEELSNKMSALFSLSQILLGQAAVANPKIENLKEEDLVNKIRTKLNTQFAAIPDKDYLVDQLILAINNWFKITKGVNVG